MKMKSTSILKSESGQLTLGFLYGVVLVLSVSALIMALTFALTLTEAIQYVAFAGARAYFAGARTEQDQVDAAEQKAVSDLLNSLPFLYGARANGWIKITPKGAQNYKEYATSGGANVTTDDGKSANRSVGYQIEFEVPILNIRLPLIGDTITAPDGGAFKSRVNAFIMREPSEEECLSFYKNVYQALKANGGYNTNAGASGAVVPTPDNGC